MNNMGGVIRCELVPIASVQGFTVKDNTAIIQLKSGEEWQNMPISRLQTSATATPQEEDGGTIYEHRLSTLIPTEHLTDTNRSLYRSCCVLGCLIRYMNANGKIRVLGTKEYPMKGTMEEVTGESASDLVGYRLKLSSSCLTTQLSI